MIEPTPNYEACIFQSLGQKQLLAIVEVVARQIVEPEYYFHYVAEEIQNFPLGYFPDFVHSYCNSLNEELDKILFLQRLLNVLAHEAVTGDSRPKDFDDGLRA